MKKKLNLECPYCGEWGADCTCKDTSDHLGGDG